MENKIVIVVLMFMLKYFFDIEKEITQTMLMTLHIRLNDVKDIVANGLTFVQR